MSIHNKMLNVQSRPDSKTRDVYDPGGSCQNSSRTAFKSSEKSEIA